MSEQNSPGLVYKPRHGIEWAYGVITVPERLELFDRTMLSLADAGFDDPLVFVDGPTRSGNYDTLNRLTVFRTGRLRAYANWVLALAELYLRCPLAKRFAVFQDDVLFCRNIRQYIEKCNFPTRGYLNLFTFDHNLLLPRQRQWGWFPSDQYGKGALALVFSREGVIKLLTQPMIWERVRNAHNKAIGIDGGIINAYKEIGWTEYVHNPSLCWHTGEKSLACNRTWPDNLNASSFPGQQFDAMSLLCTPSAT